MKNPIILAPSDFGPIMININDKFIGPSIIHSGYWARDEIELFASLFNHLIKNSPNLIFYDVGANVGTHSIAMSKIFGDKVKIRAFEAQKTIYYMLCGNIALNNIRNVDCYLNAISDEDNVILEFKTPDYSVVNNFGGLELIPPKKSDNEDMVMGNSESISTIRIDKFNEKVDFIKIDVEGMEDKVLSGAGGIFGHSSPIFFVEMVKTDSDFVLKYFKDKDYSAYNLNGNFLFIPQNVDISINGVEKTF